MDDPGVKSGDGFQTAGKSFSIIIRAVAGLIGVLLVLAGGFAGAVYLFPAILSGGVPTRDGVLPDNLGAALACLSLTGLGFFVAPGFRTSDGVDPQRAVGTIACAVAFCLGGMLALSSRGAFVGNDCGAVSCWPGGFQDGIIGIHMFAVGVVAVVVGAGRFTSRVRRYVPTVGFLVILGWYQLWWEVFLRDLFHGPAPAWY